MTRGHSLLSALELCSTGVRYPTGALQAVTPGWGLRGGPRLRGVGVRSPGLGLAGPGQPPGHTRRDKGIIAG